MKAESTNTSEDLPKQEKNQFWTVLMGNRGYIYKREKKDRIKKIMDLFEDGRIEAKGKMRE